MLRNSHDGGRIAPALAAASLLAVSLPAPPAGAATWQFTDVTAAAGITLPHSMLNLNLPEERMSGGVACGDYNNDGWLDIYHIRGDSGTNVLYRNNGDGTFSDQAAATGVDVGGQIQMGATFADWTGDGRLDLFLGGAAGTRLKTFEQQTDGTFKQVTDSLGVSIFANTYSPTFGDTDRDGDLDVVIGHWNTGQSPGHFYRNDGPGTFSHTFVSADVMWGYQNWSPPPLDYTFCFNLTDLNGDMWPDFTVSSDFNTSHVWLNDGDGTFTDVTDSLVITDTNGMGSTVGDYDNDGDIDWFVSSIYDTTGTSQDGNRLYQNDGNGVFTDVTTAAGVRNGLWGWGSTMQDFNNDGHLDIFHMNGWDTGPQWTSNPARMFVSNGDGTFTEQGASLGVDHTGQGRAVSAFDYDRDGDLDLFLFNTNQLPLLLRNDGATGNWLDVKLIGSDANTEGIGSRVQATAGATTQTREIRCGNNFNSQDAAEAHFGLGTDTVVDVLEVTWMDGTTTTMNNVPANQRLVITQGSAVTVPLVNPVSTENVTLLGTSPNPFRQGTEIRFSLATTGLVSVKIYDAGGRAVRSILDGVRNAGAQAVTWDGRSGRGDQAASGIYYYVVTSGDDRAQGKVTLLR